MKSLFLSTALTVAVLTALTALPACAPASGDTGGPSAAAGDATSGAALFGSNCASCHGSDATGGSGPNIAGVSDSQAVIDTILGGSGSMPGFASSLTDADVSDILAYLGGL